MRAITPYLRLCRLKVSGLSALSAATGFFLTGSSKVAGAAGVTAGVFLLACGCSALNQYQERALDRLMPRTRNRPLASRRLRSPVEALLASLAIIALGLCTVFLSGGAVTALIGLFTVGWYNGVYTFLKKKTAFAIIPGALVGSMPPVMGWVAAGGPPFSGELLYISFFFFMWQVPHFWLFVLRYGKEYEEAGLPSLSVIFNRNQLTRIVFAWTNALAVSAILISAAGILKNPAAKFSLFLASLWLIWNSAALLMRRDREAGYAAAFHRINLYMLVAMVAMSADRFMGLSSLL